ncbi:T9SS type A sorting domain-containing protein [Flavobacterium aestivum]|uniref:T9SS type A sorting domain-containing protein n=1 Tax=Flavobacterium aestivum TaxID=3003257 RepID=UPI0024831F82|nr:T9SS type A sorting domain-containing protein [Flavobacterium aestivum]
MKKITIILLFILFCIPKSFGQTVSINSLVVNNVSANSTQPINIHPSAITTISLSTQVLFSVPQGNNGTIDIYYRKNNNSPVITANGGSGGYLLFNGANSATRSFVITLDPAQFDPNGGYIYSEYKTSTGTTYKSANIPIVKIIPDTNIPPTIDPNYATQRVPYGGIPLLPKFVDYYDIQSQEWVDSANNVVLSDRNGWILYQSVVIRQRTTFKNGTTKLEPQQMNIIVSKFLPNYSNLYVNNQISGDQYIATGQNPGTIIGNQATESHSTTPRGTVNNLNYYQWQRREVYPLFWNIINYGLAVNGWHDIPGATQANYTPPSPSTGIEYRRLVLEDPSNSSESRNCTASNVVSVFPISNLNITNTICCNQTVSTNPAPIQGDRTSASSIYYQWQSSNDNINWFNILSNADKKDYAPLYPSNLRMSPQNVYYRRIVQEFIASAKCIYYISNVVTITYITRTRTSKISNTKSEKTELANNSMTIYPNPSSSIITIDGINNISSFKVKVIDLAGKTVISKEPNQSNNELLQLDISMLPNGIYTVELENEFDKFTKKIIKN